MFDYYTIVFVYHCFPVIIQILFIYIIVFLLSYVSLSSWLCTVAVRSMRVHGCRVATLCCQHSDAHCHPHLRRVAFECLMRMAAALQGLDAAVTFALDALAYETAPPVR